MKYNFLESFIHQNLIDFQIGTGFRLSKMLSNPVAPIYGDAENKGYLDDFKIEYWFKKGAGKKLSILFHARNQGLDSNKDQHHILKDK